MKRNIRLLIWIGGIVTVNILARGAEPAGEALFRNHGLPPGAGAEVLPQAAVLHVQFNNLYQTLLNIEGFLKAAVPAKAIPPELQPIMQSNHPLMTLVGMQLFNEPLTAEILARNFGVNTGKPISITLYPGDPRKLFIITVPKANTEAFGAFIKNVIKPKSCEEISLSGKPAVRMVVVTPKFSTELYAVCSEQEVFICGDRSMALALHNNPTSQRLNQDGFMSKVIHRVANQDISLTFNPGLIKPFILQLQQFHSLAIPLLHAQRERLLKNVPDPVKARMEMQFQQSMGVKSLAEFADFAECFIIATYECLCDVLAQKIMAFEGFSIAANLDPALPQLTLFVHSHDFQPNQSTRAIPMDEVRQAMAWLGKDFNNISVTGQKPEAKPCPFVVAWLKQAKNLMGAKGLKSAFIDGLEKLVINQPYSQPLAAKVPWVLSTTAPINAPPPISQFHGLEEYCQALSQKLSLPINRKVTLVQGKDIDMLAAYFKNETRILNQQQQMGVDFGKALTGNSPFFDKVSRFQSERLDSQINKFTLENAYLTHGGIFGYDQHEFINRRVYLARSVDGYVIYHQGGRDATWLTHLSQPTQPAISPPMAKLLARVPAGANYFHIQRVLQELPQAVDWLAGLESLAHNDLQEYVAKAGQIVKESPSIAEAPKRLMALKPPFLAYSVNRDSQSGEVYCLLPGNIAFPRGKVMPLVKALIADYAAKAGSVGGCLFYTRVQPEVYEASIVQSTEGITSLVSAVANHIIENYINKWDKLQQLEQTIVAKKDRDPDRFDEILMRNPRWEFLPTPRKVKNAKVTQTIPQRDAQASDNLVNLSSFYNAALTQDWHEGGVGNNSLRSLPAGIQELGGTKFDVRGIVQLSGQGASQLTVRFPKEVKGIKIGRKGQQIHFLHATGWASPEGALVGSYLVRFKDGQQQEIPIIYGQDVRDWWPQANEPASDKLQIVWTGKNTAMSGNGPDVRLFKTSWKNPRPEVEIEHIDYRTAMNTSAPFLIAITVD